MMACTDSLASSINVDSASLSNNETGYNSVPAVLHRFLESLDNKFGIVLVHDERANGLSNHSTAVVKQIGRMHKVVNLTVVRQDD